MEQAQGQGAPAKTARPLGALVKSARFDGYYLEFVRDAVVNDIRSVDTSETPKYRSITLAGFHQLRVDKKTHRLTCHTREPGGDWSKAKPRSFRLLQTLPNWRSMIVGAWSKRMAASLPKQLPEGEAWFDPKDHPYGSRYGTHLQKSAIASWLTGACATAGDRRVPRRLRTVLSAILARSIWRHLLDPGVLKLTMAIFGPRADAGDYNLVAKHRVVLQARVQETPNLAPILGPYLLAMAQARAAGTLSDWLTRPDLLTQARRYVLLGCRVTPGVDHAPFVQLAPPVWRYLARSSRALVQMVVDAGLVGTDNAAHTDYAKTFKLEWMQSLDESKLGVLLTLNALASTQLDVPFLCVKWLMRRKHGTMARSPEAVGRFVRLLAQQAVLERKQGALKAFISKDLPLVWDYLNRYALVDAFAPSVLNPIPKNATWASLMRQQQEWHETLHLEREQMLASQERLRLEGEQARTRRWEPILDACEVEGVTVTPLTSGLELLAEGEAMDHCVYQERFMYDCHAGYSRVFHLKRGEEQSTLQISRRTLQCKRWGIDQHFGVHNDDLTPGMARIGKKVFTLFQKAFSASEKAQALAAKPKRTMTARTAAQAP